MGLWRLFYHIVWATRDRAPIITPEIEAGLYRFITSKAASMGCLVHAIGGTENHVHVAASIPPKLSIAEFLHQIKGSSSHHVTHGIAAGKAPFGWQGGYGVFSVGPSQLSRAVAYIAEQKTHHAAGTTVAALEKETDNEDGPGSVTRRTSPVRF